MRYQDVREYGTVVMNFVEISLTNDYGEETRYPGYKRQNIPLGPEEWELIDEYTVTNKHEIAFPEATAEYGRVDMFCLRIDQVLEIYGYFHGGLAIRIGCKPIIQPYNMDLVANKGLYGEDEVDMREIFGLKEPQPDPYTPDDLVDWLERRAYPFRSFGWYGQDWRPDAGYMMDVNSGKWRKVE